MPNVDQYGGASHFANNYNFEVQRTNHFEIVINLDDLGLSTSEHLRMSTLSVSAPQVSADAIELNHGNETIKVAAKPKFNDLTITVYDTLGVDQLGVLQEWFNRVFNYETKLMGNVKDYKAEAVLYMYSPKSEVIRKWRLFGVWPKSFNQTNDFSFESQEAQNVQFELAVDRFWEEKEGELGSRN